MSNVLTTLIYANRPISTKQVAELMKVSWKAARENLQALFDLGMVEKGRVGNNKRIYWKTNEKLLDSIDYESKKFQKKEKVLKIKEDLK